MKEYEVIYKFADVIECVEANSLEDAKEKADEMLYGDYNPHNDTKCYDIEVEEIKNE